MDRFFSLDFEFPTPNSQIYNANSLIANSTIVSNRSEAALPLAVCHMSRGRNYGAQFMNGHS